MPAGKGVVDINGHQVEALFEKVGLSWPVRLENVGKEQEDVQVTYQGEDQPYCTITKEGAIL